MTELDTTPEQTPAIPAWEYADAPESKDIVRLQDRYGLFIGGEFVEPKSGEYIATIDPSTEEVLAEVPRPDPRTSSSPSRRRATRSSRAGATCPARSARSTSTGSRARSRSGRASSPSSSR